MNHLTMGHQQRRLKHVLGTSRKVAHHLITHTFFAENLDRQSTVKTMRLLAERCRKPHRNTSPFVISQFVMMGKRDYAKGAGLA